MNNFSVSGAVVGGCGRFRDEILLPDDLLIGHDDWMPSFVQGTLNILLSLAELPEPLCSSGLRALDLNRSFPPIIYRSGADIPDNTIKPTAEEPRSGDLQLWRAKLINHNTEAEYSCFLIRRVGSGYRDKAEILGQYNFRSTCDFKDGDNVTLTVFLGGN